MMSPLPLMMRSTAVLVTGIICATIAVLFLIGGLCFLLYYGKGTEPVTNLFSAASVIGWVATWVQVKGLKENTNGNQTKLIDAAINSQPANGPASATEGP